MMRSAHDEVAKRLDSRLSYQSDVLRTLVGRHLRIFFKSKVTFFFSLLVPLLTIIIYFLFIRGLEATSVKETLNAINPTLAEDSQFIYKVQSLVDKWMFSGIIAVSCITVSFNTCYVMNADSESGVNKDFISSPISKNIIIISYFIYNFVVTFIINFIILVILMLYIRYTQTFYFNLLDIVYMIIIIGLSVFSATLITIFLASFDRIARNFNSVIALVSSGIGFLIGAFMPGNMIDRRVEYFCSLIPGTYSTSLLRNVFLQGSIENLYEYAKTMDGVSQEQIDQVYNQLATNFSLNVNLFGYEVTPWYMVVFIIASIVVTIILNLIFARRNIDLAVGGRRHVKKEKKED
jgi:multidrug/hemolysin transport system permease protein